MERKRRRRYQDFEKFSQWKGDYYLLIEESILFCFPGETFNEKGASFENLYEPLHKSSSSITVQGERYKVLDMGCPGI